MCCPYHRVWNAPLDALVCGGRRGEGTCWPSGRRGSTPRASAPATPRAVALQALQPAPSSRSTCGCLWLGVCRHFPRVQAFHWNCGRVTPLLELLWREPGASRRQSLLPSTENSLPEDRCPKAQPLASASGLSSLPRPPLPLCPVEIRGCLQCSSFFP